ncbi:NADPH-dependent F420 reductase [Amycolatopsis sp. Hca4]|uniref:NADPH-dependent F420 reductase n=1 Tax=Amycolatopsis sp. Hca4 TaxID=2742131 RepID=UPI00159246DD|nr:NAD(P)-binding domain-containing protein [Amycolatopsis sp. Hca4]QKV80737.1 NAD(P)-binding domain-containing protein [Amycolatopsis sp. Hca4]
MRIGILGAGAIGTAFARRLVAGGHEAVLSNSRGPETLAGLMDELGPGASAGTRTEAARADIVVLAVPRAQVATALDGLPDWDGRILVDATNDFAAPPPGPGQATTSEQVAALAPGARVLKALNHLFAASLAADPRQAGGQRVLFVSGDDDAAKKAFTAVLDDLGYAPIDLGGLAAGGRLHQARGGPLVGHDLVRLASAR